MNSELYLALQTVPFIDIDGVFAVNIESLKEKLPEQDSELFVNYVKPIYLKQLENIRISDTDMQKYRDGLGTPESVDEYLALQRELKYQAINYGDIHNLNGYAAAMSEIKTTAEARNPSVGYARNITTIHIRYFYIVDMSQTHVGKSVKYYTRKDLFTRELITVE